MKNFIFLLFIFFIPVISSATISMSPPQIDFVGKTNEEICEKIILDSSIPSILFGEDRWAKQNFSNRELSNHNLFPEEHSLIVNYPKEIFISNKTEIDICIIGKNSGNYHGILLYRIKDKPIKVGIWMNVSLEKTNFENMNIITKSIIFEKKNYRYFLPLILIIILIILLSLSRRKSKKGKVNIF